MPKIRRLPNPMLARTEPLHPTKRQMAHTSAPVETTGALRAELRCIATAQIAR
jgi:hypothetical protein